MQKQTSASDSADSRLVVPFEDNHLAQDLLGHYDANLALLEDRLGIEAVAHGNIVTLTGPKDAVKAARDILNALYKRLSTGETIGIGEVDGALRHAGADLAGGRARPSKPAKGVPGVEKTEPGDAGDMAQIRTRKRVINARSPMQSKYLRALTKNELVFATGPAGTGKTYLAVAHAAARLERGEVERLILSRPAVEAGERLGFLPGDMREKVDPYLRPLYDALYDVLPPEKVERGLDSGIIEIAPLAFMRGRTLAHAQIILDEAQNCTSMQMKMFLTRLGEGSQMVVTGDPSQIDLPDGQICGLNEALTLLTDIPRISQIAFTSKDVVRHELVARIVEAYEGQ